MDLVGWGWPKTKHPNRESAHCLVDNRRTRCMLRMLVCKDKKRSIVKIGGEMKGIGSKRENRLVEEDMEYLYFECLYTKKISRYSRTDNPDVILSDDGYEYLLKTLVPVHRSIYCSEYGQPPRGWHVHHIDGVKLNNRIENLIALPAGLHIRLHECYLWERLPGRRDIERMLQEYKDGVKIDYSKKRKNKRRKIEYEKAYIKKEKAKKKKLKQIHKTRSQLKDNILSTRCRELVEQTDPRTKIQLTTEVKKRRKDLLKKFKAIDLKEERKRKSHWKNDF